MAKVYNLLLKQIPEHVLESYPLFCKFLDYYYRWLSTRGIKSLEEITNIDYVNRVATITNITERFVVEYKDKDSHFDTNNPNLYMRGYTEYDYVQERSTVDGSLVYNTDGEAVYRLVGEPTVDHYDPIYELDSKGNPVIVEETDSNGFREYDKVQDAMGVDIVDSNGNKINRIYIAPDETGTLTKRKNTLGETYYTNAEGDHFYPIDRKTTTKMYRCHMVEKVIGYTPVYVYQTDENGDPLYQVVMDIYGEPVYNSDGSLKLEQVPVYEAGTTERVVKRQNKTDENGKTVYEIEKDKYGNNIYIVDEYGRTVPKYSLDDDGNRIPVTEPCVHEAPVARLYSVSSDAERSYISIEILRNEDGTAKTTPDALVGQTVYTHLLTAEGATILDHNNAQYTVEASVLSRDSDFTLIGKTVRGEDSKAIAEILAVDSTHRYIIRYITQDAVYTAGETAVVRNGQDGAEIDRVRIGAIETVPSVFIDHFIEMLDVDRIFDKDNERIALLLKHSRDLYQSKGTEEALKFLLKMSKGIDATVHYPTEQILRPSDGVWHQKTAVLIRNVKGLFPYTADEYTGEESDYTTFDKITGWRWKNWGHPDSGVDKEIYIPTGYESFRTVEDIHRFFFNNTLPVYVGEHIIAYYTDENGTEVDVWEGEVVKGVVGIDVLEGGGRWQIGQIFSLGDGTEQGGHQFSYDTPSKPYYIRRHENMDKGFLLRMSILGDGGTQRSVLDLIPDNIRDFEITDFQLEGLSYTVNEFWNDPQTEGILNVYVAPLEFKDYARDPDGEFILDKNGEAIVNSVVDVYPTFAVKYLVDPEAVAESWDEVGQTASTQSEIKINGFQLITDETDLRYYKYALRTADPANRFNPDDYNVYGGETLAENPKASVTVQYVVMPEGEAEYVDGDTYEMTIVSGHREYGVSGASIDDGTAGKPTIAKVNTIDGYGVVKYASIIQLGEYIDPEDADRIYENYPTFVNENYVYAKLDCTDEELYAMVGKVLVGEHGEKAQVIGVEYNTMNKTEATKGNLAVLRYIDDWEFEQDEALTCEVSLTQTVSTKIVAIEDASRYALRYKLRFGASFTYDGYWEDDRGKISNNYIRLEDSYYYQDLSYDIQSEADPDSYISLAQYLHPAGTKMFTTYILGMDLDLTYTKDWGISVDLAHVAVSFFDIIHATDRLVRNGEIVDNPYTDQDGVTLDRGAFAYVMLKRVMDEAFYSEDYNLHFTKAVFDDVLSSEDMSLEMTKRLSDETILSELIPFVFTKIVKDKVTVTDPTVWKLITKVITDPVNVTETLRKSITLFIENWYSYRDKAFSRFARYIGFNGEQKNPFFLQNDTYISDEQRTAVLAAIEALNTMAGVRADEETLTYDGAVGVADRHYNGQQLDYIYSGGAYRERGTAKARFASDGESSYDIPPDVEKDMETPIVAMESAYEQFAPVYNRYERLVAKVNELTDRDGTGIDSRYPWVKNQTLEQIVAPAFDYETMGNYILQYSRYGTDTITYSKYLTQYVSKYLAPIERFYNGATDAGVTDRDSWSMPLTNYGLYCRMVVKNYTRWLELYLRYLDAKKLADDNTDITVTIDREILYSSLYCLDDATASVRNYLTLEMRKLYVGNLTSERNTAHVITVNDAGTFTPIVFTDDGENVHYWFCSMDDEGALHWYRAETATGTGLTEVESRILLEELDTLETSNEIFNDSVDEVIRITDRRTESYHFDFEDPHLLERLKYGYSLYRYADKIYQDPTYDPSFTSVCDTHLVAFEDYYVQYEQYLTEYEQYVRRTVAELVLQTAPELDKSAIADIASKWINTAPAPFDEGSGEEEGESGMDQSWKSEIEWCEHLINARGEDISYCEGGRNLYLWIGSDYDEDYVNAQRKRIEA